MKTKQLLLVLVAFMFVAISGCGKYEDGPSISFLPKKARLVNKWKIEKTFINDVEQTLGSVVMILELKKDNSYIYSETGSSTAETGTWAFDGSKENIIISPTGFGIGISEKILRLKNNELWLSYTFGTDTYEEHYVTD